MMTAVVEAQEADMQTKQDEAAKFIGDFMRAAAQEPRPDFHSRAGSLHFTRDQHAAGGA